MRSRDSCLLWGTLWCAVTFATACADDPIELSATIYRPGVARCTGAPLDGRAGTHNQERTEAGMRYNVRTPTNYDPSIAHALLMVYPGAGHSPEASERFTDLTGAATKAGFIVAYTDHRRLSLKVLNELASIPRAIAAKWCIDRERIFLTGHSDGGTAAAAIAFRADDGLVPAGIAPSAAGIRAEDLAAYECPPSMRVMVLHNSDDKLFPGFGAEAAAWWAQCMQCEQTTAALDTNGCQTYSGCVANSMLRYCEGAGGHRIWPAQNDHMLNFFN